MAQGLVNVAPGQCLLSVTATTNLRLNRYAGKWIPIKVGSDWLAAEIPAAGVNLANTGLTAATLYYIYAFDSSDTLTLEASTTVHATDADTGVEIKSGDATRTLVGMVFMDAGTPGTFVNSTAKRWCLNWFNRQGLDLAGTFSVDRTTTSTTFVEIDTEIRVEYLTWADEVVAAWVSGSADNNSAGNVACSGLGFNSTTVPTATTTLTSNAASQRNSLSLSAVVRQAEGKYFLTLLGAVSAGTGTWHFEDAPTVGPTKVRLWASIRG